MARFLYGAVAFLGLLIGFLGAVWQMSPAARIYYADMGQIKKGMTLAEISAVLGVPPGEYYGNRDTFHVLGWRVGSRKWRTNDVTVNVIFDEKTRRATDVYVNWESDPWERSYGKLCYVLGLCTLQ